MKDTKNLSTRDRLRKKLEDRKILQKTKENNEKIEIKTNEITEEIKKKYTLAKDEYPESNISDPITILKNKDKYIKEYNSYILTVIETAKDKQYGMSQLNLLLDNSYTRYMTMLLELPKVPEFFSKYN